MKVVVVGTSPHSVVAFRGDMIRAMLAAGHEVLALAPEEDEDATATLASWGATYRATPIRRTGQNPIHDAVTTWSLARTFRSFRADVVLVYGAKPVVYGLIAARLAGVARRSAMIAGAGTAFTEGAGIKRAVLHVGLRNLYRISLRHAQTVFFQNPDDERLFRSMALLSARNRVLQINGSGVNLERYAPEPMPPGPITFLLLGRMIGLKGVREYVDAARIVKARFPDARFHLAGAVDTNPTAISAAELDRWHRDGVVEYLGSVRDVRPLIASSHVSVLPSHGGDGVPHSLLEAMAMARPIIATDVPGCRETVDGRNGYLVPPRDARALARAMIRVLEDPDAIAAMGHASRSIAEERFDVEDVNRTILSALGM